MQLPPDLAIYRETLTTSATPNTESVTTLALAAPGSGLRFRVWAWGMSVTSSADTSLVWSGVLRIAASSLYSSTSGGLAGVQVDHPGGLAWATNTQLSIQHAASAASQSLRVWVAYTVEYSG